MADLATAHAALRLGLARGERREVVVEHELLVLLDEDLVHLLHVQLGAEGHAREGLGLAAGEDGGTVGAGEVIHLAPDRTHLIGLAAVQTAAFVQDHVAHGFLLGVMVVAVHHGGLRLLVLLGQGSEELGLDGLEAVLALVLGSGALGELVALVVAELMDSRAKGLVLLVVRVVALVHVGAELVHELLLHAAVLLDLLVGELDGLEHVVLGHLVHLTLDHHDVLLGGGDHEVQVGALVVLETGVDHELAVDAGDADLGDRTAERQVGGGEGAGSGEAGEGVGLDILLRGDEVDVHEDLEMEVIRPQGTDGTVHEAGDEHLVVRGTALALEETAREPAGGIILFTIIYGEGHEVGTLLDFLRAGDGGEQHRASHLHHRGTGGLLGQFSGLDLDDPTVGQLDLLLDDVHLFCFCYVLYRLFPVRPGTFFIKKGERSCLA